MFDLTPYTQPIHTFLQDTPSLNLLISYFLGAIPFAVWIGRKIGVDPRTRGSKNPGASNIARTLGVRWGVLILILDALKGAAACALALWSAGEGWAVLSALIAILGHCTSPFLRFKGGRGVATVVGGGLVLHPGLMGICLFCWISILWISKTAAWASLAMVLVLVILSQYAEVSDNIRFFAIGAATIVGVRHWTYIKIIFHGSTLRSQLTRRR